LSVRNREARRVVDNTGNAFGSDDLERSGLGSETNDAVSKVVNGSISNGPPVSGHNKSRGQNSDHLNRSNYDYKSGAKSEEHFKNKPKPFADLFGVDR